MKANINIFNRIKSGSIKTIVVIIGLFFSSLQLAAQKPKTARVAINYKEYPSNPLPKELNKYYVDIVNSTEYKNLTTKKDKSRIKLLGSDEFTYVEDLAKADLRIDVALREARYDTIYSTIISKKYTTKTEFEQTTKWQCKINVILKTNWTLKEIKNNKTLASLVKEDTLVHSSKTFISYAETKEAFEKEDIQPIVSKNLYKLFTRAKRVFVDDINDLYGYPRKTSSHYIILGKETDYNYQNLADAYEQFKSAVSKHNKGVSIDDIYGEVENSIQLWEKAITEYKPNTEKAKINDNNINYLYTAIAAGKFLRQQYDEAKLYLDKVSGENINFSSIKKLDGIVQQQIQRANVAGVEKMKRNVLTITDIDKINYLAIYQLYMNYELVEKHQNLQLLPNYFPSFDNRKAKEINFTGESARHQEKIEYTYDRDKTLKTLTYSVDRGNGFVTYDYNLIYSKAQLDGIDIAGKRKVTFEYNENGLLKSIKRIKNEAEFEYVLDLSYQGDAFNIKLFVTNGNKRQASSQKYFIKWNENLQLTEFNFDIYSARNYTYNKQGDVASFLVNTVNASDVKLEWVYEYDANDYWVSKEFGQELQSKRTLIYY